MKPVRPLFAWRESDPSGLDRPPQRRLGTNVLVSCLVLSLALVALPCCALIHGAHAAPVPADVQLTHDDHSGPDHSHSSPGDPDSGSTDDCDHWVDHNPFLVPYQAVLAQLADMPGWQAADFSEPLPPKRPGKLILRPPIERQTSPPRLYLLFSQLRL